MTRSRRPAGSIHCRSLSDHRRRALRGAALAFTLSLACGDHALAASRFVRGDSNIDGTVDLSDAVRILGFLFLGAPTELDCQDAADTNDDGIIDLSDSIGLLALLFQGGKLPAQFGACIFDGTADTLGCASFSACDQPPPSSIVWVTPLEIDFGPVAVGTRSGGQEITVVNNGSSPLTSFAGGAPSDPQFEGGQNCAPSVAPGAQCTIAFKFSPTRGGESATTSRIQTSAGPIFIRMRGTGIVPSLTVTPRAIDFGPVEVGGTSKPQSVTITNSGLVLAPIHAIDFPEEFRVASFACPTELSPTGNCSVTFNFTPLREGVTSDTSHLDTGAGRITIDLRGTGVTVDPPRRPLLWITPLSLEFDPTLVGRSSPFLSVLVTNVGGLSVRGITGALPEGSPFAFLDSCPETLDPGETCEYAITFSPDSPGEYLAETSLSSNAGSFKIHLQGRAVERWIWVTPLEIDFGPVRVASGSAFQEIRVTNLGPKAMSSSESLIKLAPDSQFLALIPCPTILPRDASCALQIKFTPRQAVEHSETAEIVSPLGNVTVVLRGTGVKPVPR